MSTGGAGLSRGITSGFGMMDAHLHRKAQRERQAKRDDIADERYEQTWQRQEKMDERNMKREDQADEWKKEDRNKQNAQHVLAGAITRIEEKKAAGIPLTEKDYAWLRDNVGPALDSLQMDVRVFTSPVGERAAAAADHIIKKGDMSILEDRENRRAIAEATAGPYLRQSRKGETARSGKPRTEQEVYDAIPDEDGNITMLTMVGDGDERYIAKVTEDGKAGTNSPGKKFDQNTMLDRMAGFHGLYKGMEQSGLLAELRAAYAGTGGDPSKFDDKDKHGTTVIQEGGENVTYNTVNGKIVGEPIARGSKWQPNKQSNYAPMYKPVETDKGIYTFDQRTGTYAFSGLKGTKKTSKIDPAKERLDIVKELSDRMRDIDKDDPEYMTPDQIKAEADRIVGMALDEGGKPNPTPAPEQKPSFTVGQPRGLAATQSPLRKGFDPQSGLYSLAGMSEQEANAVHADIPPGTEYIGPDGKKRIKK